MSRDTEIKEIQRKVSSIYAGAPPENDAKVPIELHIQEYILFSRQYLEAAKALEKTRSRFFLPSTQLWGHAIELVLKATLLASGQKAPHHHDLNELCTKSIKHGFHLTDKEIALIAHLHHLYYEDFATGTKFKNRYPTKSIENVGGVVPTYTLLHPIYECLVSQIQKRVTLPLE